MLITDAMLHAAVRKAAEVNLLLPGGCLDTIEEGWQQVRAVLEAALAEVESPPSAVPCEDHLVLDIIARTIAPEFPGDGPVECVTRESECVEFRDGDGQRYEIVVRPIPDSEDRP